MTTFVDTNILIYLLDEKSPHHEWSKEKIAERKIVGPLIISDIVYSEFSVGLDSVAKTDEAISSLSLERASFTNEMLFRAGKAFREHREKGGNKSNVLSDFLIGAQAEIEDAPLLTMDTGAFKGYFPKVALITPT
jgi:predicted nucleic acid-binding protein